MRWNNASRDDREKGKEGKKARKGRWNLNTRKWWLRNPSGRRKEKGIMNEAKE